LKEIRPVPCGVDTSLKLWRAAVRDVGEPPPGGSEPKLIPADRQATLFCPGGKRFTE